MSDVYLHSVAMLGTVVSIQVVGYGEDERARSRREAAVGRAVDWFRAIETSCNRFDASSEVRCLAARPGEAVSVSAMLFEAVQFALAVAEESGGALDPTVGLSMEARGFNREYQSGRVAASGLAHEARVSYRDVTIDPAERTVTIGRPLLLDLGAVAKGLAIDMAARELQPFENFAIDAGGDLYLAGRNAEGQPWSVGIRHPRDREQCLETLHVTNVAVCTSGDYERRNADTADHHILDPRTGRTAGAMSSVTVVAPSAMVADALATAAFVLGPVDGLRLLERSGVEGLMVTPSLDRISTPGWSRAPILPDA